MIQRVFWPAALILIPSCQFDCQFVCARHFCPSILMDFNQICTQQSLGDLVVSRQLRLLWTQFFPSNRGLLSNSASNGLIQTKFWYSSHAMTLIELIQFGCYGRCFSLATGVSLATALPMDRSRPNLGTAVMP